MSRIIAGSRGGRRLAMPPGDRTRPTTDRVREALFSAVAAWAGRADAAPAEALAGLAFCDLYAGSGAVGLEAASRGAGPVLLVEGNRRTATVTERNVAELGLSARVRAGKVETLVAEPATQAFDVVFLDPPYDVPSVTVTTVLAGLAAHGWLLPDALVVVERSKRTAPFTWPALVGESWDRGYGETVLHYGSCGGPDASPATETETETETVP
jgi:16S rRNA (guanine966-N2)-methyltransferase